MGGTKCCSICEQAVEQFEVYGEPPRLGQCPHCGAKPRHRALKWYVQKVIRPTLCAGDQILGVGPGMIFTRWFTGAEVVGPAAITAIDIRKLAYFDELDPPHRFVEMDVTRMDFRDDTFSVIICNNTLPYVPDVSAALSELARCLRPDGIAILVSNLSSGRTLSAVDYRAIHPKLDEAFFAANGTAWYFGQDYYQMLQAAGFEVCVDTPMSGYSPEERASRGLKVRTELIVGFKSRLAKARFEFSERVSAKVL